MGRPQIPGDSADGAGRALEIRLLGGFRLAIDGWEVTGPWRTGRARALVKLLALAPQQTLHREQIFEALWPEQEPAAAANNLYFALHAARRVLDSGLGRGVTCLSNRQGLVRLAPSGGVTIDVAAFEDAASAASASTEVALYEVALSRYGGDLLPEDRHADWTTSRRMVLRGTYLALLGQLAGLRAARGEWEAAIGLLGRLIGEDALREEAHAALMRAFVASGQRERAVRQYATLRDLLRRELAVEPEPSPRPSTRRSCPGISRNTRPHRTAPPGSNAATSRPRCRASSGGNRNSPSYARCLNMVGRREVPGAGRAPAGGVAPRPAPVAGGARAAADRSARPAAGGSGPTGRTCGGREGPCPPARRPQRG